jgi:L-aspartate oxidase
MAQQFAAPFGWELQNMLSVAWLMIRAALSREETRGCHVRTDFPQRDDPAWNRHVTFRREGE